MSGVRQLVVLAGGPGGGGTPGDRDEAALLQAHESRVERAAGYLVQSGGGEPLGQGQPVVGVLGQQREQTGFQESAQEARR